MTSNDSMINAKNLFLFLKIYFFVINKSMTFVECYSIINFVSTHLIELNFSVSFSLSLDYKHLFKMVLRFVTEQKIFFFLK